MKNQAAVLQAVVIVVVMITALLRRKPEAFIKRKLKPFGQIARSRSGKVFAAAEKGVQMTFSGAHIIENIFRTQDSLLGL